MEFSTKAELFQFLADQQAQIVTLQETVDSLRPAKEEVAESEQGDQLEETTSPVEEIDELDKLLQE